MGEVFQNSGVLVVLVTLNERLLRQCGDVAGTL